MDPTTTDDTILERFLAGEGEALQRVQGWVDAVVHLGRWRFSDPEGVGQDIVMRLLTIVRSGRYERRSSFKTFVFAVAKYTCVDQFRRERLREQVEMRSGAPAESVVEAERALEQRESLEFLGYVLQRLPEECRHLWKWVYGEGLSAAEVGQRLGVQEGTVRVRVHRCLQKARGFAVRYAAGSGLA